MHQITLHMTLPDQTSVDISYQDLLMKSAMTVLYFYPKDNTPGCTKEAHDFALMNQQFAALGVQIVGVSKDTHKSHCSFIEKQELPFALISDPEWTLHSLFDTVGEKSMYGKKYQGTIRSSFLLDQQGMVLHEWRNVSVTDHVTTVLSTIQQIVS